MTSYAAYPRVLVLDPHHPSQYVFLQYLQQVGFIGTGVASVGEAKALLKQVPYQAVAFQCPLRDASFVDVMTWLRPTPTTANSLYLLAITSMPGRYSRQLLLEYGADDYLVKPVPRHTAIQALLRMMAIVNSQNLE